MAAAGWLARRSRWTQDDELMLRAVLIELAAGLASPEPAAMWVADACNQVIAAGECVVAAERTRGSAREDPAAIASVRPSGPQAVEVVVRLSEELGGERLSRQLRFTAGDPARERWRSVGLVVATLVGELVESGWEAPAPPGGLDFGVEQDGGEAGAQAAEAEAAGAPGADQVAGDAASPSAEGGPDEESETPTLGDVDADADADAESLADADADAESLAEAAVPRRRRARVRFGPAPVAPEHFFFGVGLLAAAPEAGTSWSMGVGGWAGWRLVEGLWLDLRADFVARDAPAPAELESLSLSQARGLVGVGWGWPMGRSWLGATVGGGVRRLGLSARVDGGRYQQQQWDPIVGGRAGLWVALAGHFSGWIAVEATSPLAQSQVVDARQPGRTLATLPSWSLGTQIGLGWGG